MSEPSPSHYGSALLAEPRVALTPGVLMAVLLHALVFGGALILPRYFDRAPPLRKPIIARLVALGKPRDPRLLPRAPSAPPPAPPSRSAPAPVAPLAPPAPSSRPSLAYKAPAAPAKPRAPTRSELMQRALAQVKGHAPSDSRDKPDPDRAGEATGSPSGTAESAEAGEKYYTEVHDAIQANYVVPSVISERERLYLSATVVAWIKADGSLLRHELQKKSGNHFFDEALELAVQRTRLPPPPPELARSLRDEGLALSFRP